MRSFIYTKWLRARHLALLATFGVVIVVAIAALYLYLLSKSPLSFSEMDFNDNGVVTFSELIHASSHGIRPIRQGDGVCREYYALGDGTTLRIDCP